MGVNISEIVPSQPRKLEDFKGKIIAIDAYNALYQFLSIIRQPDGTPLMDSKGRITSHLSGLIYRTSNFLQAGIKPVYVFDGEPHKLKGETIESRQFLREKAMEEWKIALEEGDIERARTKAQQASRLTREMVDQSKLLLQKMGLPYIQAPSEGEAQASEMARKGDVWACASQDFDSLLFGSPYLVRNLTITGKRKLPRKNVYVDVEPELIELNSTLKALEISRDQLIEIGILIGTDFNPGVKGIGPKKALMLIKKHGSLKEILKEEGIELEGYEEIKEIFLNPVATMNYDLEWGQVDEEGVRSFLCEEFDFSVERIESALQKISDFKRLREQKSLDQYF